MQQNSYTPKFPVRIVTAASLFDGHDAAINLMRRILQSSGAEVIHLGHNRSVHEIVTAAIQEDVHAIAITSYQGGHLEFFKYIHDLLLERGAEHIKIFGGGGGTILQEEIEELHQYGITRLYSPDDGRKMGLQGMINDLIQAADYELYMADDDIKKIDELREKLPRILTHIHDNTRVPKVTVKPVAVPVLGITGTGGAGKSSLVDELIRRFINHTGQKVAILSVDPTRKKTGGALLGDRIRMNAIYHERVYMRSFATRASNISITHRMNEMIEVLKKAQFDLIILETSGIGQSDSQITELADASLYVMTPEYGAASQLEKIDMLDFADIVALNKADKRGALDALRDVKKQMQRNRMSWDVSLDDMPVYATMASQFNDPGVDRLFGALMHLLNKRTGSKFPGAINGSGKEKSIIIPPSRVRYLAEIAENSRKYDEETVKTTKTISTWQSLAESLDYLEANDSDTDAVKEALQKIKNDVPAEAFQLLEIWPSLFTKYTEPVYRYKVRGKEFEVETYSSSLSGTQIPRIALPKFTSWADRYRWMRKENVPGEFPFTAGVFPFKRKGEDPTRMFAGEGNPERTNRRFHYVSRDSDAKRLSTAFDSVTLYGMDPNTRPDIYGKVGNSGVSVCCLDDAKKLYSGFDLSSPMTSVSMTINGPAAAITAFFMNAAIDQQCEKYIKANGLEKEVLTRRTKILKERGIKEVQFNAERSPHNDGLGLLLLGISGDQVLDSEVYEKIKAQTVKMVRGTVQADILKEDQAQNTCIFSTEFSLRLMGDMQKWFVDHQVRNFYSVSISGYHIAEAGANPISQLAFTLANGFTYVEYYLNRGMHIDEFAPNLSFFFSNGIDPEYAVIGRVARRIWAKAMKNLYGANERSQKLKYHIQTSGRSLHAQEISFNDIRTTLQALYAIYDNCNSLHTNAYDEAITTPTEESVRRAMAIQLIINKELGLAKNENPLQGSFIIEELTDLVEEAVLAEFDRLNERGGVLGAMETMYQRGKIQDESMYYETLKHTGELPIVGVNTFLGPDGSAIQQPEQVIRATKEEKQYQLETVDRMHKQYSIESAQWISRLKEEAGTGGNTFDILMEAAKYCTLGQLTQAMFEVGGEYRRNM